MYILHFIIAHCMDSSTFYYIPLYGYTTFHYSPLYRCAIYYYRPLYGYTIFYYGPLYSYTTFYYSPLYRHITFYYSPLYEYTTFYCIAFMNMPQFIHSLLNGHLSCVACLTSMNSASVNLCAEIGCLG